MATIKIKGMSCNHCVMAVTKALNEIAGIKNVKVDLSTIPEEDFNLFIKPFITKESLQEIRESLGN